VAIAERPAPAPAFELDEAAFEALAATHRRALIAHAYRMLGSIDDAEDAVQETFARAWRSRETYREDTSARAWLYRIATNACLDAIERRRRLPGGRAVVAIEPVPERLFADVSTEPDARYDARESVSMAFLTALQRLTPQQRAVLILRDVLVWHATEVAELLDVSVPAANSTLNRARRVMGAPARMPEPFERATGIRALLDRYVRAWETADIPGLVALLREDAVVSMPPGLTVIGAAAIARFLAGVVFADERHVRLSPVDANGGPAFRIESRSRSYPEFELYAVVVLGLAEDDRSIASMEVFADPRVGARFS
jgi:RNA polymerase sigma-70 factor (ECF subfamily)